MKNLTAYITNSSTVIERNDTFSGFYFFANQNRLQVSSSYGLDLTKETQKQLLQSYLDHFGYTYYFK